MTFKKIMVASDHGGYKLKQELINFLKSRNIEITDGGCDSEESVDYPIYGEKAARAVADKVCDGAIIICGSGIGISIAANRIKGVRAALCHSVDYAKISRMHNNANILALGGRFTNFDEAKKIIIAWLDTEYEGGRHEKRIKMLDEIK
ncbi:MAG: ribose 5-phosphate isomerase B [Chitinispirillales bacterium]|jgi:ribose 5-phosphate isomerase B|nr:ribose 5-phosphate isomerase B [Chitinispirillales bacterium]